MTMGRCDSIGERMRRFVRKGYIFPLLFGMWCVLLLGFQTAAFLLLADINYFSAHTCLAIGMIDALVILAPYALLPPRFRWSVVFPMVLFPLFLYVNLLYFRNFEDLIGLSSAITGTQNMGGVVFRSALNSVEPSDLYILLPFLFFAVSYCVCAHRIGKERFPRMVKAGWPLVALAALGLQQIFLSHVFYRDFRPERIHPDDAIVTESFHYRKLKDMPRYKRLEYYGFIPYLTLEAYDWLRPRHIRLSEEERGEIAAFLGRERGEILVPGYDGARNRQKNVVLVIVESLNSSALDMTVNGKPALPFLRSLAEREGTMTARRVVAQTGPGRSSDGQFMYNTGLLPIPGEAVAMRFPDARYPSLSRALGMRCVEFNPSPPHLWNHKEISESLGSELHGGTGKDPIPENSLDRYIMDKAASAVRSDGRFLMAIYTMDSHDPYVSYDGVRTDVWDDDTFGLTEKVYLEKLRQFDRALARFVDVLKRKGVYDNTLLVIVSDHEARRSCLSGTTGLDDPHILFMAVNAGVDMDVKCEIGQIDVFPTILDLAGVETTDMHGAGTSMLRNPAVMSGEVGECVDAASYPTARAWDLCVKMITGGYFRQ